jgi:hypothetical protein
MMINTRTLPFGAECYKSRYVDTGKVPTVTEIRVFMATLDVILGSKDGMQLAAQAAAAGEGSPEFLLFDAKVSDCYHRVWEDRDIMTHEEICAMIGGLLEGGQQI